MHFGSSPNVEQGRNAFWLEPKCIFARVKSWGKAEMHFGTSQNVKQGRNAFRLDPKCGARQKCILAQAKRGNAFLARVKT